MVGCEARGERAGFLATHTLEAVRLDLGSVAEPILERLGFERGGFSAIASFLRFGAVVLLVTIT